MSGDVGVAGREQKADWFALVAQLLFWGYIATVLGAGIEGMVFARLDFPILLHQQVGNLSPGARADVLSQYRFLRGIEAGFGLMCIWARREIFTTGSTWNRLFLCGMGMGILGRVIGWAWDGAPTWAMFAFLGYEVVAWVVIVVVTRPFRRLAVPTVTGT